MAKKKIDVELDLGDDIGHLTNEINSKYGGKVFTSASHILDEEQEIIPVSPYLDIALSGGIPLGSWVSVSGPPKKGKTSMLLTFAASCQKHGIKHVFYINAEHRLKKKNLGGIAGLNTDSACFHIIESTAEHIMSAQDFLESASNILRKVPRCLLIIDSASSLVQAEILEGGIGTTSRGGGAKLMSQFIDLVQSVVPIQKSIVCGITHLIADTSGKSFGTVEKSGWRWRYQADVRIKVSWAQPWKVGGDDGVQIGQIMKVLVEESSLGAPGMKCDAYLRYGVGIDRIYEIMEMAKAANLIETGGAWHTLAFIKKHPSLLGVMEWNDELIKSIKSQGAERCYKLLKDHPQWIEVLQKEVMDFIGVNNA